MHLISCSQVAQGQIYSGTHSYLENIAPRNGVETTWLEHGTVEEFEKAIRPNTKVQMSELVFRNSKFKSNFFHFHTASGK